MSVISIFLEVIIIDTVMAKILDIVNGDHMILKVMMFMRVILVMIMLTISVMTKMVTVKI